MPSATASPGCPTERGFWPTTSNTGEIEKSIVNMYGHLHGHIQRGVNDLETMTNSLLRQKTDAARALLSALRLLGQQPFRRFMLDEGRHVLEIVRATLDGEHVRISPGPEHRRRLSELSHAFTVASAGAAAPVPGIGKGNAAAGGLQRKYLELLALGLSNKEIGRTMGVSVNTVKYHLKGIFRELRAESRTQALAEAYRLQIIATPEVEV